MTRVTIEINVDDKVASHLASATPSELASIEFLLSQCVQDWLTRPHESLLELMDQIGEEAQRRGLTPEILESILNER